MLSVVTALAVPCRFVAASPNPYTVTTREFGQGTTTNITFYETGVAFVVKDARGMLVAKATIFPYLATLPGSDADDLYRIIRGYPHKTIAIPKGKSTLPVRLVEHSTADDVSTWLYALDPDGKTCLLFDGQALPRYKPTLRILRANAVDFLRHVWAPSQSAPRSTASKEVLPLTNDAASVSAPL